MTKILPYKQNNKKQNDKNLENTNQQKHIQKKILFNLENLNKNKDLYKKKKHLIKNDFSIDLLKSERTRKSKVQSKCKREKKFKRKSLYTRGSNTKIRSVSKSSRKNDFNFFGGSMKQIMFQTMDYKNQQNRSSSLLQREKPKKSGRTKSFRTKEIQKIKKKIKRNQNSIYSEIQLKQQIQNSNKNIESLRCLDLFSNKKSKNRLRSTSNAKNISLRNLSIKKLNPKLKTNVMEKNFGFTKQKVQNKNKPNKDKNQKKNIFRTIKHLRKNSALGYMIGATNPKQKKKACLASNKKINKRFSHIKNKKTSTLHVSIYERDSKRGKKYLEKTNLMKHENKKIKIKRDEKKKVRLCKEAHLTLSFF